jgi:chromosome segregation ATPase
MAYSNAALATQGNVTGPPQVNNPSMLQYPSFAPYSPQGPTAMFQHNLSTMPEWASGLIDSVNQIKAEMTKLNDIDKNVKSINVKMSQLETKVIDVEHKVNNIEESCNFLSDRHDSHENELKGARDEIKKLREECSTLGGSYTQLNRDKKNLESKVQDLEWRSMRENLMFFGIPEQTSETGDCSVIIREFCQTQLCMDNTQDFEIDRAHRIGKQRTGAIRPIVVKFHKYEIKERIRSKSYERRDALKLANVNVREQWPKEMMERRRQLYPVMNEARLKGNTTRLVRDKLYINNREYVPTG